MQPLSRAKRRIYLYGLTLLFIMFIPIVALYATGYRYKNGFGLVQTGGIYVSVPYSGASVALDGKSIGQSGFLERSFFVDNLTPGAYRMSATRLGFIPWHRVLVVEPRLVTDASVLLIPEHIQVVHIVAGGASNSTSTLSVSQAAYASYRAAFSLLSASTSVSALAGEVALVKDGNVYVRWSDPSALPPSTFCGRPSYCTNEIALEQGTSTAISAAFFGGGVVYATKEQGVFFTEVDARPNAVVAALYLQGGADFRIVNGALVVKDGVSYYLINL